MFNLIKVCNSINYTSFILQIIFYLYLCHYYKLAIWDNSLNKEISILILFFCSCFILNHNIVQKYGFNNCPNLLHLSRLHQDAGYYEFIKCT